MEDMGGFFRPQKGDERRGEDGNQTERSMERDRKNNSSRGLRWGKQTTSFCGSYGDARDMPVVIGAVISALSGEEYIWPDGDEVKRSRHGVPAGLSGVAGRSVSRGRHEDRLEAEGWDEKVPANFLGAGQSQVHQLQCGLALIKGQKMGAFRGHGRLAGGLLGVLGYPMETLWGTPGQGGWLLQCRVSEGLVPVLNSVRPSLTSASSPFTQPGTVCRAAPAVSAGVPRPARPVVRGTSPSPPSVSPGTHSSICRAPKLG